MISANISEIKTNFSYYINLAVKKGEQIIICNHNIPVAELRATSTVKKGKRKLGVCKDKILLPDDFNETSQDIIKSFYSDNIFPKTHKKPRKK
jgi:antitoxin (DNA-binding transcriptional repressor) of toxin-antitoxin stability system